MSEDDDFPKTIEDARRKGLTVFRRDTLDASVMLEAAIRPCKNLNTGEWCQKTNRRPDGSQTICYCDENKQCNDCVIDYGATK